MSDDSPYRSPQAPPDWQQPSRRHKSGRPRVIFWHEVYCGFMVLLYIASALLLSTLTEPSESFLLIVICVPLAIGFGVGVFLPREPWAWIYGIVTIGIGMTSCATLPFCIPLLIFWIKPETKAYFDQRYRRGVRDSQY